MIISGKHAITGECFLSAFLAPIYDDKSDELRNQARQAKTKEIRDDSLVF